MQMRHLVVLALAAGACAPSLKHVAAPVVSSFDNTYIPISTRAVPPLVRIEAGTTISLTIADPVSSRRHQVGDVVAAVIKSDVTDSQGRVVIPAGAEALVKIAAFQAAMPHRDDARIVFEVSTAMTVDGQAIELPSAATAVPASLTDFTVKAGTRVEFRLTLPVVL